MASAAAVCDRFSDLLGDNRGTGRDPIAARIAQAAAAGAPKLSYADGLDAVLGYLHKLGEYAGEDGVGGPLLTHLPQVLRWLVAERWSREVMVALTDALHLSALSDTEAATVEAFIRQGLPGDDISGPPEWATAAASVMAYLDERAFAAVGRIMAQRSVAHPLRVIKRMLRDHGGYAGLKTAVTANRRRDGWERTRRFAGRVRALTPADWDVIWADTFARAAPPAWRTHIPVYTGKQQRDLCERFLNALAPVASRQ